MVCQVLLLLLSNGWFNRNWWYLTSVTNIPTQLFIISWTRPFSCNLAKNHCRKTWVMMTIRNVILYIHRRTRSLSRVPGFPFQDSFLQFQKKKAEKEAWKKAASRGLLKRPLEAKRGNCYWDSSSTRVVLNSSRERGCFNKQITHRINYMHHLNSQKQQKNYGYRTSHFDDDAQLVIHDDDALFGISGYLVFYVDGMWCLLRQWLVTFILFFNGSLKRANKHPWCEQHC